MDPVGPEGDQSRGFIEARKYPSFSANEANLFLIHFPFMASLASLCTNPLNALLCCFAA